MRKVATLDKNLNSKDPCDANGVVNFSCIFDMTGDAETEVLILNDGDESLALSYYDRELLEDLYIGDMIQVRAELGDVGNTSRKVFGEVYKLATPASRAGKENPRPGDMVWFEQPHLVARFKSVLVVKKQMQRGVQPDGIVADPWEELDY